MSTNSNLSISNVIEICIPKTLSDQKGVLWYTRKKDKSRRATLPRDDDFKVIVTGNNTLQSKQHEIICQDVDLIDEKTKKYIARFRTKYIPQAIINKTKNITATLAKNTDQRGDAAGPRAMRTATSNFAKNPNVFSTAFGYIEDIASGRKGSSFENCRLMEGSKSKLLEHPELIELIEEVDNAFKVLMPQQHKAQWQRSHLSDYFLPNTVALKKENEIIQSQSSNNESNNAITKLSSLLIPAETSKTQNSNKSIITPNYLSNPDIDHYELGIGSSFSTFNVNKDFQTHYHKDKNDYILGFGNLIVFEPGKYEGGYLVLPEYGFAFDVREGDFLALDVHKVHGNTSIKKTDPSSAARISLVAYLREDIATCPVSRIQEIPLFDNPPFEIINTKLILPEFEDLGDRTEIYTEKKINLMFEVKLDCEIDDKIIIKYLTDHLYLSFNGHCLPATKLFEKIISSKVENKEDGNNKNKIINILAWVGDKNVKKEENSEKSIVRTSSSITYQLLFNNKMLKEFKLRSPRVKSCPKRKKEDQSSNSNAKVKIIKTSNNNVLDGKNPI